MSSAVATWLAPREADLPPGITPAGAPLQPSSPNLHPFSSPALPWLLSSLVLALIPLAGQLPVWVTVGFVGCAFWRQLIESRGWGLPSLGWRLGLFSAAGTGVFLFGRRHGVGPGDPEALTAFLVALISLKLLELRSARDFTLLALLGYFLLLACFFSGQSLPLTLYLLGVVVVNTVALVRCHGIVPDAARADFTAPRGRSQSASWWRPGPGAAAMWPTTRLAGALVLQALPLAAAAFVLFPRLEGRLFSRLGFFGGRIGVMGLSSQLRPGAIAELERSEALAFRARISGEEPLPARTLYWRALTMQECTGSGLDWQRTPTGRNVPPPPPPPSEPPPAGATAGNRVSQQITVEPHGESWLLALDRPVTAPERGRLDPVTGDLRSAAPVDAVLTYTVESIPSPPASERVSPLGEAQRRACLALPARFSPRARALAQSWREAAGGENAGAKEIAAQGLAFFGRGGFVYTLSPDAYPANKDALELFLFRRRRGFCEHYAAAFAALMRAAGVPARIVTGYQGGQWNPIGSGYYIVRQADAHAWVETWQENRGWRRVDPTSVLAPERLSLGAETFAALGSFSGDDRAERVRRLQNPPWWQQISRDLNLAWDTLDQGWNSRVLDFGASDQRRILGQLGLGRLDWAAGCATLMAMTASALGLGALAVRWIVARWTTRLARRPAGPGESPAAVEAARLYRRFCRRLDRRAGLAREPGEGPLDFAARVGRELPGSAQAVAEFTRLYVTLRYGRPGAETAAPTALPALRAAARAVRC